MEKELRIIISGGGTGGHIFPAVSIANAIIELRPDAEILFVGAEGRMEMQRVPDAGYRIIGLPIAGFDRKRLWKNVSVLIKLMRSQWKARKVIKDFRPQVAGGGGGEGSGCVARRRRFAAVPARDGLGGRLFGGSRERCEDAAHSGLFPGGAARARPLRAAFPVRAFAKNRQDRPGKR